MKVLALDQSSKITGYAIFEDEKLINYGHFTCAQTDLGLRLLNIRKNIQNLIEQNNIQQLIIEDIQLQGNVVNNVATFKTLAEVRGVIYELAAEMDIKIESVYASTWKSSLGIKSSVRKDCQLKINKLFNIVPTEDEADAICIGQYYVNKNQDSFDWAK